MLAQSIVAAPVTVTVQGAAYVIEPHPASAWITAIVADPVTGVVPKMLRAADRLALIERMLTGDISDVDLIAARNEALSAATGRDWWVAVRLIGAMDSASGELYGRMLLAGIRADLPIAAWCSAAYALIMDGRDEKGRTQVIFDLINPPAGVSPQEATGFDTIQF
jgi:hypothetical protein